VFKFRRHPAGLGKTLLQRSSLHKGCCRSLRGPRGGHLELLQTPNHDAAEQGQERVSHYEDRPTCLEGKAKKEQMVSPPQKETWRTASRRSSRKDNMLGKGGGSGGEHGKKRDRHGGTPLTRTAKRNKRAGVPPKGLGGERGEPATLF